MTPALLTYLVTVLVMSLVCFATYGWDKRRSLNGGRRVSEKTLQLLAFFGGWPGAIIGQRHFRHKTKTLPFLIVFWAIASAGKLNVVLGEKGLAARVTNLL